MSRRRPDIEQEPAPFAGAPSERVQLYFIGDPAESVPPSLWPEGNEGGRPAIPACDHMQDPDVAEWLVRTFPRTYSFDPPSPEPVEAEHDQPAEGSPAQE